MTAHTKAPAQPGLAARSGALKTRRWCTGQGRFTADLAGDALGALCPQPARRRERSKASKRRPAPISITAADLKALKPIRRCCSKFNYVPVGQPILADGVVRFTGEPIAAVVAASKDEAEDLADQVEVEIVETTALVDGSLRSPKARRWCMPKPPATSSSKARSRRPASTTVWKSAHKIVRDRRALAPAKRHADGSARRPRRLRCLDRPGDADLHDADAASDPHRHLPTSSACRNRICA